MMIDSPFHQLRERSLVQFTIVGEKETVQFLTLDTTTARDEPMMTLVRFAHRPEDRVVDIIRACVPTRCQLFWQRKGPFIWPMVGMRPSARCYRSEIADQDVVIQYRPGEAPEVRKTCERLLHNRLADL